MNILPINPENNLGENSMIVLERERKSSHKLNTTNINDLNLKNEVLNYLTELDDITLPLNKFGIWKIMEHYDNDQKIIDQRKLSPVDGQSS